MRMQCSNYGGAGPLKEMATPLIARFWRVQGTREKVTICAAIAQYIPGSQLPK